MYASLFAHQGNLGTKQCKDGQCIIDWMKTQRKK